MQVVVGRISRAHGIRGEVTIDIRTDEPERRFAPGSSVRVGEQEMQVRSSRRHSGRLLVQLEGVVDRTAAEALQGRTVSSEVDPDEATGRSDEFYDRQLVGLEVVLASAPDAPVGRVTAVQHLPAQDHLVVRVGTQDVMVPFVEALVPSVDLQTGTVTVVDLPGLLDPDAADEVR
ncbi:ribosome maturation factor RimM [Aeromicrobium halocynthiae]|uniref:Ribosome maturation factor RimM n=1 Tax=Aeromicrobium halocynthiae TaxID=560557 RepID=A0ABN2W095_9ACTN